MVLGRWKPHITMTLLGGLLAIVAGCIDRADRVPAFNGGPAWGYLVQQYDFGPRVPGSDAHKRAIHFIIERLRAVGAEVTVQRFDVENPYADGTLQLTNVIGSFATDTSKRVLLAAHFDSRPWADQETVDSLRSRPVPGANDGASGVAVLLEIADLIAATPPGGVGVDLVFFDGEDYGKEGDLRYYLLGSKHFAANLGGYRPACGVLLDMVGGREARFRKEGNSIEYAPQVTDTLFARAARLGLEMFVGERSQPIYDDHIPLLRAGIPTVDIIGLPYAQWHTVDDTPEACSRETLRQVGAVLVDFIYNFPF